MQTADQLVLYLEDNGWKPSQKFPDTGRWRFLQIRGFVFCGVICVVPEGLASKEEVKSIASYMKSIMPIISLGGIDLVIVYSQTPSFTDLSDCLSRFRTVTIQKIIQFTSEKVNIQNKTTSEIFDTNLGGIILNLAGSREIVSTWSGRGPNKQKVWDKQVWRILAGWFLAFVLVMYFARQFQQPKPIENTPSKSTGEKR